MRELEAALLPIEARAALRNISTMAGHVDVLQGGPNVATVALPIDALLPIEVLAISNAVALPALVIVVGAARGAVDNGENSRACGGPDLTAPAEWRGAGASSDSAKSEANEMRQASATCGANGVRNAAATCGA